MLGTAQVPAVAQAVSAQPFAGFSTSTPVGVNALTLGTTDIANAQEAFSSATVNSQGLNSPIVNEQGKNVQPATPGKNAYGHGVGLDLGLVNSTVQATDISQVKIASSAEAFAPPPTGPIVKEIPVNLNPVAYASLVRGTAQATYDPNTCVLGQPFSYGAGHAANVQLLNTAGLAADGSFAAPLLGSSLTSTPDPNSVTQSRSFTYLIANGDGTFGLVSETHQLVAPVNVLNGAVTIEVAGELVMRAIATGKPGGARIEYNDPVLTIKAAGVPILGTPLKLSQLLGSAGVNVPLPPVATITLAGPPRAIGGAPLSPPATAPDGTSAAAAWDAIGHVALLTIPGVSALDLRLGHMEAAAIAPPGGIKCSIPVKKTGPATVQTGQDYTIHIEVPDAAVYKALIDCDLVNISAVDLNIKKTGNVAFRVVSADHGGVISGTTISWANLGSYKKGDPPIVLSVTLHATSGSGVIEDQATVKANLTGCKGGAAGQDIVGNARLENLAVSGVGIFDVTVNRGNLSATGGNYTLYLVLGGGLMLAALGIRRRLHSRPDATTTTS